MEVGRRVRAPPAASPRYSIASELFLTIRADIEQQILNHMNESGVYTEAYLQGFKERLNQLKLIIENDRRDGRHNEQVLKYMSYKLQGTGE